MSARDQAMRKAFLASFLGLNGSFLITTGMLRDFEAALRAAGYVVVPREPTREMWAASANALVNGRVKLKAHHDYISETVWNAMLAASEATP